MKLHKNSNAQLYKSHTQAINKHNIIKFQAWADPHVNFPYLVRAPFQFKLMFKSWHVSLNYYRVCILCYVNLIYMRMFNMQKFLSDNYKTGLILTLVLFVLVCFFQISTSLRVTVLPATSDSDVKNINLYTPLELTRIDRSLVY